MMVLEEAVQELSEQVDKLQNEKSSLAFDVPELNNVLAPFIEGKTDLHECIGAVWNKAYILGASEATEAERLKSNNS